jgi:AraC-like DNA-binding protein
LPGAAEGELAELLAFKECQDLFRKRLAGPLLKLIPQLTGLRLRVWWHGRLDFQGPDPSPVLCPRARQRAGAKDRPHRRCESCLRRRWKPASSPANQGRRFIGQCGVTNFCAGLQVDKARPLTLVLQARITHHAPRTTQHTTSPAVFQHAVALARLILHDLEATAQARLAGGGWDNALRSLDHTRIEAARLRGKLRHRLPGLPESKDQPGLGSHAQELVKAMLDFVHEHYHRPFSLGDLAAAMKMNASYLSALFSQTTGMTFHQFLEDVRLSEAKAWLRDPRRRIGEVAGAAGYASPDAFRHAFKAHEGVSPEAWRAGQ